jgi:hypothetical protein
MICICLKLDLSPLEPSTIYNIQQNTYLCQHHSVLTIMLRASWIEENR